MIQRDDAVPAPLAADGERQGLTPRMVLLASGAITLLLYGLPFGGWLSRPFLLLSTLAHEMGHGLTTLLLGGRFQRLLMWSNGSGLAEIDLSGFGRWRQGLSVAGGLVGPAVAAALCFGMGRTRRGARACLLGIGLLLAVAEVLVVRNPFGLAFTGLVAAACMLAGWRGTAAGAQLAVVFIAVQLALSVFSRADYLFARTADNPTGFYPSDSFRMQQLLWLPHWFWGGLCGAFAAAVVAWGLRLYWRQ